MKTVLGIVVIVLFVLAGIFMIAGGRPLLGALFIVVAVANGIIIAWMSKLNRKS